MSPAPASLHRTQSAVSQPLKRPDAQRDCLLVARIGRRLHLTETVEAALRIAADV